MGSQKQLQDIFLGMGNMMQQSSTAATELRFTTMLVNFLKGLSTRYSLCFIQIPPRTKVRGRSLDFLCKKVIFKKTEIETKFLRQQL